MSVLFSLSKVHCHPFFSVCVGFLGETGTVNITLYCHLVLFLKGSHDNIEMFWCVNHYGRSESPYFAGKHFLYFVSVGFFLVLLASILHIIDSIFVFQYRTKNFQNRGDKTCATLWGRRFCPPSVVMKLSYRTPLKQNDRSVQLYALILTCFIGCKSLINWTVVLSHI